MTRIREVIIYLRLDVQPPLLGALFNFLPPPERVSEMYVLDGRVRIRDAQTGFFRDVAVKLVGPVRDYVRDIIKQSGPETLTKLRIFEPLWTLVEQAEIPTLSKLEDLSIMAMEDRTLETNIFFRDRSKIPKFPGLKTLTFMRQRPTYPAADDHPGRYKLPPIVINPAQLATFIDVLGVKPTLILQGVVLPHAPQADLDALQSKIVTARLRADIRRPYPGQWYPAV
ncbi:hypothetical protein EXIGLDRAFT_725142 [Exidia glandulosa HHB12029]|uniref:Uncharacterized protein n=1 Tax=Exidia glandulosa HHB12029 TaxID=1314781 RepID=A0A165E5W3_EXIGL|nr:hypothetical protein EXIGLDRAFT_725142 [Exidia glandulosa HHB12029]